VRVSEAKALDFRNRAVVALAAEHGLTAPANSELLRNYEEMCATTPDRNVDP
jgi:glutaminase